MVTIEAKRVLRAEGADALRYNIDGPPGREPSRHEFRGVHQIVVLDYLRYWFTLDAAVIILNAVELVGRISFPEPPS